MLPHVVGGEPPVEGASLACDLLGNCVMPDNLQLVPVKGLEVRPAGVDQLPVFVYVGVGPVSMYLEVSLKGVL